MEKTEILRIQIASDKKSLQEDVNAGLRDFEHINKEIERIRQKQVLLEDLLEKEQILNEQGIYPNEWQDEYRDENN